MRIAFDLDGVLADLHTPFARVVLELFPGMNPAEVSAPDVGASPPDPERDAADETAVDPAAPHPPDIQLTRRQSERVWKHIAGIENFWETLAEIEPGAIARLATLAADLRWEVIFVTSRPSTKGLTVQRQSQRWLDRQGFAMPSLFVVHGSRGRIADALALDVVVDDRSNNCLDVVLESRAGSILVWRGDEQRVPASARRMGIAVVSSVAACLDALVEAQRSGQESGFLDRLRKVFGVGTKAAAPFLRS